MAKINIKSEKAPPFGEIIYSTSTPIIFEEELDANNKYLHYEFVGIKPEPQAHPEKPKVKEDDKEYDSVPPKPSTPPSQKITPEIQKIIQEGLHKGMEAKDIAVHIRKRAKVKLNEDYLRKYIKNNFK